MIPNFVALGKRIKYIRNKRGLSQADLAEKVGCSAPFISYVENGLKSMSLETFIYIANSLNVSSDELLRDSLENTLKVSNHTFADVLADCTEYEIRILQEIVSSAKVAIRSNRQLLRRRW